MVGYRCFVVGKCVFGIFIGIRVFFINFGEYIYVFVLENGLVEWIFGFFIGFVCWELVLSEYFLFEYSVNLFFI